MMMLCLSLSRFASASTRRNGAAGFATAFVHHGPSRISRQASYINNRQTVAYSSVSDEDQLTESGYKRPTVQWYPGHIAKAERQLSETLKAVDVVVEVRDARACKATAHPKVGEWCAGRPRIVVLTHLDMIPRNAVSSWKMAYDKLGAERWDDAPVNTQVANQAQQARDIRFSYGDPTPVNKNKKPRKEEGWEKRPKIVTPVEQVMFINAKQGEGIHALQRAIFKAGAHVQERRERRGLKTRSLRVGIIGYPNVGKSALINKILGRRRARTANTPGVTRSLQWIRVRTDDFKTSNKEFELLDSPGIIPAKMVDQSDALLLAACNCIGEAAYDNQAVAAYLCEWLKTIHVMEKQHLAAPEWREKVKERYKFDPMKPNEETGELLTGEDMLFLVADNTCQGDPEDASRKILGDFRAGRMGPVSLQLAPETEEDDGQLAVPIGTSRVNDKEYVSFSEQREQEQQERARMAVETAKERGLELPPIVENPDKVDDGDIGKGMFDGW